MVQATPSTQLVSIVQHPTWRWAFLGLGLALLIGGAVIWDVRSPNESQYNCIIMAVGTKDHSLKATSTILYDHHFAPTHNVLFSCDVLGRVFVNDREAPMMASSEGRHVKLLSRQYKFLPNQWRLR